jgi:FkbM family methyltransferase
MNFLKRLIPFRTKRTIKENLGVPMLHWSLLNLKRLGYSPTFVVDAGAYEGYWTRDFLEVFPESSVLMLEAQSSKESKLQTVCQGFPLVHYHIALLSATDGAEFGFIENETASHITADLTNATRVIKGETVDEIIRRKGLPFPDFFKLDVQGFELEVLKGSKGCLLQAEFCLLEVTLLQIGEEPLMINVINFMDEHGFQPYDICQFIRRPYDQALYQIDLLFVKKSSSFISERRWN